MSKKPKIKPDTFTWTNPKGEKITMTHEEFEFFNVKGEVIPEVQGYLDDWLSMQNAFSSIPYIQETHKYQMYKLFLYHNEQMIFNWAGLQESFPWITFDITQLENYDKYMPVMEDEVYSKCNEITDYDTFGIEWEEVPDVVDQYLRNHFPLAEYVISGDEVIISQTRVNELFDSCLTDPSYKLTNEEVEITRLGKNFSKMSSRWIDKTFKERKIDKELNWKGFESQIFKRHTSVYKLGSCINPNIHGTHDANPRLHKLVSTKLKRMFKNWFDNKHLGRFLLDSIIISPQDKNKQVFHEEHLVSRENPDHTDDDEKEVDFLLSDKPIKDYPL